MTSTVQEEFVLSDNPLDIAEAIARDNDWRFERLDDDELVIDVQANWCAYRLIFVWQADVSAIQFCVQTDLLAPEGQMTALAELMATINARTWLGHFHLSLEENTPMFRYTLLLTDGSSLQPEQIEDVIDWGLMECERYYPAFQAACKGETPLPDALNLALLDAQGEA